MRYVLSHGRWNLMLVCSPHQQYAFLHDRGICPKYSFLQRARCPRIVMKPSIVKPKPGNTLIRLQGHLQILFKTKLWFLFTRWTGGRGPITLNISKGQFNKILVTPYGFIVWLWLMVLIFFWGEVLLRQTGLQHCQYRYKVFLKSLQ